MLADMTGVLAARPGQNASMETPFAGDRPPAPRKRLPVLTPAQWIWYPSGRTLQNTFILFRRELDLADKLRRATGWIAADSRYLLEVNGRRIQWGPAPGDPRWPEADPVDLTAASRQGRNAIAVHLVFGETRLPARFLTTWSQGMTKDGYFLDTWPAYDRLARLIERQLDLTVWGPILDHGVQFNFDCWHHYNYTSDLDALREPYPRLLRFADYLRGIQGKYGLLPVENIGIPSVWIDHIAYQAQRHKQCAFNLYAAAAMQHALAPICRAFGDAKAADAARIFGEQLLAAAAARFWSRQQGLFVNNLPWLAEERTSVSAGRAWTR